ncbi:hypothetical protein Bca4012_015827 [Brassica carinata]
MEAIIYGLCNYLYACFNLNREENKLATFISNSERVLCLTFHATKPWILPGLVIGEIEMFDYREKKLIHGRFAVFVDKSLFAVLEKSTNQVSVTNLKNEYSSVEEAEATTEAVYNLQWPPNGGRLLTAEFVGPEEVKAKLEAPLPPQPQPQPQTQAPLRPPPPPLAKAPPVIERTKAIPRIYYLPLSEDKAAAKLAANNK